MSERPFAHLHCHTHYSLLDGANRIPELVAQVKSLGMNAVSITDHGNLYGAIEFYRECKAASVNPVIGYEAYVAPTKRTTRDAKRRGDAGYHLTLLAKNLTGFKNLIKMSSIAFLEGYHYVPRIDKELLEAHSEGIVCLSGCASSEFSEFILKDQLAEATRVAEWFATVFRKDFYVEIQNNGIDIQKLCAQGAIDIANKLGLPLVATSDAHYLTQGDSVPHDVLLCLNMGRTIKDENRMRFGSDQFYIRPPEDMYRLFPEQSAAVRRSQEIADGCDIQLDFKKRHFPVFIPPEGKTPEDYLRELCVVGMNKRYRGAPSEVVRARLEHELDIICRMGFASYMLIVSDFVRFAVDNGIPSSARGSACGALVSYVLELSHVDPLEYDLLFERFLDPNRSEAPDIDIDFCQDRREEVIAYVRRKYGEASVAQIATFGTLAARAAIKDVGRVFDMPLQRVIQLTDMIPTRLGITLDEALKENADLRALYESDLEVRRMLDVARALEGTNRQCGIHAAGVVIANGPLTDYVPLHRAMRKGDDAGSKQREAVVATQWVMGDLEKVGLLKMDFLGLRTLTLLTNAVGMIEKTRGIKVDLMNLPLDDKETYDLLQRGDAKGVFQLESDGIRELLKRLRPDNIRDIIALMALYRPGPLEGGMVDDYVNIKHGRAQPSYAHPVMEEVLAETYGVMCIHEDALVSLADGTEKPIKLVRQGDMVHSLNLDTRHFEAKECEGCGPTRRGEGIRLTLENGFSVLLTPDHEVWTTEGWKESQHLVMGDSIAVKSKLSTCLQDLRTCSMVSAERVYDQQFYGMSVADHHNLVADGIVVKNCYQEQIMRILNRLGGIELAPAYACIKAISKKKYDIINDRKIDFVKGAGERGLAKQTAEEIFDLIVKFGGYGFNKSHSAAYAQLGYQTAYLKRHFTPEFMAALLSSEIDDGNKRDIMVDHIADSKKLGVDVLPPDVNRSYTEFAVSSGKIVFGLAAIKGCGRVATEAIVQTREEGGRFKDIFDFCERIDHKAVPRAAIEKLIKAGAFDKLGGHRAQVMHVLTRSLQAASERQNDKRKGQRSLFDTDDVPETNGFHPTETLPEVEAWPETEKLKYEKEVLDFYMTSHPLAQREAEIRRYISHGIGDLKGVPAETEVTLGGMLTQLRIMAYKKPQRNGNTRYGRCKIEDFGGIIETVLWGDEFNKYKDAFLEDEIVIVRGRLERKTDEPMLQVTRLLTLEQAQRELASKLHLLFELNTHSPVDVDVLGKILKKTPGACPVQLTIKDPAGRRCILQLGRDFYVNPATYHRDELESLLGAGGVLLR